MRSQVPRDPRVVVTPGQERILPVLVMTLGFSRTILATMIPSRQAGGHPRRDVVSNFRRKSPQLRSRCLPPLRCWQYLKSLRNLVDSEQVRNARIIIETCRRRYSTWQVQQHAAIVATSAAIQESSLRNLAYGDRDSVGPVPAATLAPGGGP